MTDGRRRQGGTGGAESTGLPRRPPVVTRDLAPFPRPRIFTDHPPWVPPAGASASISGPCSGLRIDRAGLTTLPVPESCPSCLRPTPRPRGAVALPTPMPSDRSSFRTSFARALRQALPWALALAVATCADDQG